VRKRSEFVRIQASTARVTTKHLLLLIARGPTEAARLGVVASRKVGPSVERSRAKRLVREAFRLSPDVFPAWIDVVVIVRPGTHEAKLADLTREMRGAAGMLAKRAAQILSGRLEPGGAR
jgi:ribonuclease P protein component